MRCIYLGLLTLMFSAVNFEAFAQNVTVSEASSDDVVNKKIKPSVDKLVKIDNYAKKMNKLKKKGLVQAEEEKASSETTKTENTKADTNAEADKTDTETDKTNVEADKTNTDANTKSDADVEKEIEQKDIQEIKNNAKLSPQELLKKVREERLKQKQETAAAPMKSNKVYNKENKDRLKARREERKKMTKAERRENKEELKAIYKARREERRNMTKAERKQVKEDMKVKEKARREQQKEDRKKRRQMRKMDK